MRLEDIREHDRRTVCLSQYHVCDSVLAAGVLVDDSIGRIRPCLVDDQVGRVEWQNGMGGTIYYVLCFMASSAALAY